MPCLTLKFHETSVTRSLISGKARIGSTVTGFVRSSDVEPRHAHQPRIAIDFRRARSALASLAVPPHREVVRLLGLDPMHGVEHDHAFADFRRVVAEGALLPIAAPDSKRRLSHVVSSYAFSLTICCNSAGIGGIGTCATCIAPSGP